MIRIVGLGPGDPDLLTLGGLEALRSIGRAATVLAPPELVLFLESEGIELLKLVERPGLFMRGSREEIDAFVLRVDAARDIGLGVLGNPLSDFAGLPVLLRGLEARGIAAEIVPGVPKATLSAAIAMPLIPLPPGSEHHSWEDLVEIMARLRRSCPWDREQTHRSLVPYLIEETFEVAEAIEHDRDDALCEELGDLLLQIVFHSQVATERGKFSIADVIDALSNKMVRRHPHVFGDQAVSGVAEVWKNWEQIKAAEGAALGRNSRLDGIPKALGALQRAQKMQEKASRVGFDWPDARAVTHKLSEEILRARGSAKQRRSESYPRGDRRHSLYAGQRHAAAGIRLRRRSSRSQRQVLSPLRFHGTARVLRGAQSRRSEHRRARRLMAAGENRGVTLRVRMSAHDAHYGGNLVDGARILALFGDVATQLLIEHDGDEGLFAAYESVEFLAPVHAGDFIEAHGEITKVGTTSRAMSFEARKIIAARPDLSPSAADVLDEPLVVVRARGTCVVPKSNQRKVAPR